MNYHWFALYIMVINRGLFGSGLSIPNFNAKTYRFTSSLIFAYEAKTQFA